MRCFIPWLYFYSLCKRRKHVCTVLHWSLCGRRRSMQQTNTTVLSLICAVKRRTFKLAVFMFPSDSSTLFWAAAKFFFLWLTDFGKVVFGVVKIALWGKKAKQSCLHSSSSAECFNVALHLKGFFFLSDQKPSRLRLSVWISSSVVKA